MVQQAGEIITNNGCPSETIALPLGQLYGLTDEWGAGWGRTRDALTATVRIACSNQLALTEHR